MTDKWTAIQANDDWAIRRHTKYIAIGRGTNAMLAAQDIAHALNAEQWQIGEAQEMAEHYKRERDKLVVVLKRIRDAKPGEGRGELMNWQDITGIIDAALAQWEEPQAFTIPDVLVH